MFEGSIEVIMFVVVHINIKDPPECLRPHLELTLDGPLNDVAYALVNQPRCWLANRTLRFHYLLCHLVEQERQNLGIAYLAVETTDFI